MTWIISTVIMVVASVFGTARLFKRKVPLYFKMAVCAAWCVTAQLLYQLCLVYCVGSDGAYSDNILSGIGSNSYAAFLFAANYGPLNSVLDEGDRKNKVIRVFAFAASLIFVGLGVTLTYYWCRSGGSIWNYIGYMLISASLMPSCVYFNVKFLFIHDDEVFVRGIRPVNLCSLLFCFAFLAEMFFVVFGYDDLSYWCDTVGIWIAAATVFAADWGRRAWRS